MIIIQALLFIIIYVPLIVFDGFVITKLWKWFIVPQGLNELTIPYAIGIATLISFVTYKGNIFHNYEENQQIPPIKLILSPIIVGVSSLIIGYIVHLFA